MVMRWLACSAGSVHIFGPCPESHAKEEGLIMATIPLTYTGRVTARCLDCNKAVDYYVDANEEKIWRLVPVEAKGMRIETPPLPG
jgi:hypothetical protein